MTSFFQILFDRSTLSSAIALFSWGGKALFGCLIVLPVRLLSYL